MSRTEHVRFTLSVNKSAAEAFADEIKTVLGGKSPEVAGDDTLSLTYEVFIQYWGDVAARLAAIRRLLKAPDVTVAASMKELTQGHCIIENVVRELTLLQQRLSEKTPTQTDQ